MRTDCLGSQRSYRQSRNKQNPNLQILFHRTPDPTSTLNKTRVLDHGDLTIEEKNFCRLTGSSLRQWLVTRFREKRSGCNSESVYGAEDHGGAAVVAEIGDESTGEQGSGEGNEPRCVEAEAHCGCAHVRRVSLRQPRWAPRVLTQGKYCIDGRDDEYQVQVVRPQEENRRKKPGKCEPCHRYRLSSPGVRTETKRNVSADRAEVVRHTGKAGPSGRR